MRINGSNTSQVTKYGNGFNGEGERRGLGRPLQLRIIFLGAKLFFFSFIPVETLKSRFIRSICVKRKNFPSFPARFAPGFHFFLLPFHGLSAACPSGLPGRSSEIALTGIIFLLSSFATVMQGNARKRDPITREKFHINVITRLFHFARGAGEKVCSAKSFTFYREKYPVSIRKVEQGKILIPRADLPGEVPRRGLPRGLPRIPKTMHIPLKCSCRTSARDVFPGHFSARCSLSLNAFVSAEMSERVFVPPSHFSTAYLHVNLFDLKQITSIPIQLIFLYFPETVA